MALVLDGNGTMTVGNGDITGLVAGALPSTVIGAGAVLQVVQANTLTETTIATTTYTDTTLTCSITPTSSTSKILVMINQQARMVGGSDPSGAGFKLRLLRGATNIIDFGSGGANTVELTADGGGNARLATYASVMYLDSPSTTSATTYKTQASVNSGAGNSTSFQGSSTGISIMTLMEIAA